MKVDTLSSVEEIHLSNSGFYELYKKEFKQILQLRQITTKYQPIVSLTNGEVFGYEGLSRGPLNSYFHNPEHLFTFAETEGLLYSTEKLARESAFLHSSAWIKKHEKLFINIDAQVIYDKNFTPGHTIELLENYNLTPQNIVFEITERNAINDFKAFKNVLQHYKNQGFQIAVDDAGAGYSSLHAISELQPDYIKIDRSLIQNIHKSNVKANIVEALVMFAKKMNSKLIAEGIETSEELEKVMDLGIDFGQGFLLAKPNLPVENISFGTIKQIQEKVSMVNEIGDQIKAIAVPVKQFHMSTAKLNDVVNYFYTNNEVQYAMIDEGSSKVAIITREKLKEQKML